MEMTLREFSRKGGAAGRGAAKRRGTPEHYREMAKRSVAKRAALRALALAKAAGKASGGAPAASGAARSK